MSKKNKKEQKKLETKQLIGSQIELIQIKLRAFNEVVRVMEQRKNDINNSINVAALELGVPENQIGEWGLAEDGKTLIRSGKKKRFPSVIGTTVKKREKEKKKGKGQPPEKEE